MHARQTHDLSHACACYCTRKCDVWGVVFTTSPFQCASITQRNAWLVAWVCWDVAEIRRDLWIFFAPNPVYWTSANGGRSDSRSVRFIRLARTRKGSRKERKELHTLSSADQAAEASAEVATTPALALKTWSSTKELHSRLRELGAPIYGTKHVLFRRLCEYEQIGRPMSLRKHFGVSYWSWILMNFARTKNRIR